MAILVFVDVLQVSFFLEMKIRRRLLVMLFLAMLIWVIQYSLQHIKRSVNVYDSYIFYPLQSARIVLFGWIPFSAGDVLYVLGGLLLLITIVKWIYYIARFGLHRERLAASLIGHQCSAIGLSLFYHRVGGKLLQVAIARVLGT